MPYKNSIKEKIYQAEYYLKNKNRLLKNHKLWREEHKEEVREYNEKYRLEPGYKERQRKLQKEWCSRNKEKIREKAREWYSKNREKAKKRFKRYYEKNKNRNKKAIT